MNDDDTQADAEPAGAPLEVTVQPGDEMNDINSENFVSKFNLLDDHEFDKAMKACRAAKQATAK
jgi:hypothetical protein